MTDSESQTPIDDPALSALYRQAVREEPGPALDTLILQRARQSVGRPGRRRGRLALSLSAAAILLLSVGVMRLLLYQHPEAIPLPSAPQAEFKAREVVAPPALAPQGATVLRKDEASPPVLPSRAAAPAVLQSAPGVIDRQLAEIRRLHASGDRATARKRLQELVTKHPEITVPEDLGPLLRP